MRSCAYALTLRSIYAHRSALEHHTLEEVQKILTVLFETLGLRSLESLVAASQG